MNLYCVVLAPGSKPHLGSYILFRRASSVYLFHTALLNFMRDAFLYARVLGIRCVASCGKAKLERIGVKAFCKTSIECLSIPGNVVELMRGTFLSKEPSVCDIGTGSKLERSLSIQDSVVELCERCFRDARASNVSHLVRHPNLKHSVTRKLNHLPSQTVLSNFAMGAYRDAVVFDVLHLVHLPTLNIMELNASMPQALILLPLPTVLLNCVKRVFINARIFGVLHYLILNTSIFQHSTRHSRYVVHSLHYEPYGLTPSGGKLGPIEPFRIRHP